MRNKSNVIGIVFVVLAIVFTVSCGSPPKPVGDTEGGVRGGTLSYRVSSPPKSFNYVMTADEPTMLTAFVLLTSRIVDFDHKTQKYVPGLAESWKVAEDGKTVAVKLRPGLKFSDGKDLTAEDAVFTLRAIYDEKVNSPAWKDAMLVAKKPIAAKAVDAQNIEMIFPERVASVENYLFNLGILPAHILKSDLDAGTFAEAWKLDTDPEKIVSSGAFMVETVAAGERIVLKRNPNYWKKDEKGEALPYLDKLSLEITADANNAMARLGQNTLDLIDRIRPADFASLSGQPAGAVKATDVGPGLGTDHIWFNLNPAKANGEKLDGTPKYKWFSDVRFRRAVSMAIDRNTIAMTTLRGLASPLYGFVSPGNRAWAKGDLPKTEYSRERALQSLTEAGFVTKGTSEAPELFDAANNRVAFTLVVPAENEPRKLAAAVIQEDLAKIGIKMEVAPVENQNVTERWSKSFDYDAILFGLSVSDIEPSSFGNFLKSDAAAHQWHPEQKIPATEWEGRIDKLFAKQGGETDPQKRAVLFGEIQKIMADELPVIPVVARHIVTAANTKIGNHSPSPIFPYSLWNADQLFIRQ